MVPDYMWDFRARKAFGCNGQYDDSYGKTSISDYLEYNEEYKDSITGDFPADTPMFNKYSRRQVHIIKGTIPSSYPAVSKTELAKLLVKAERYEDEETIAAILDNYIDILDEEDYSCPDLTVEEFEELLAKFSTFVK